MAVKLLPFRSTPFSSLLSSQVSQPSFLLLNCCCLSLECEVSALGMTLLPPFQLIRLASLFLAVSRANLLARDTILSLRGLKLQEKEPAGFFEVDE